MTWRTAGILYEGSLELRGRSAPGHPCAQHMALPRARRWCAKRGGGRASDSLVAKVTRCSDVPCALREVEGSLFCATGLDVWCTAAGFPHSERECRFGRGQGGDEQPHYVPCSSTSVVRQVLLEYTVARVALYLSIFKCPWRVPAWRAQPVWQVRLARLTEPRRRNRSVRELTRSAPLCLA